MHTFPDAIQFCLSASFSALAGKRFLNCLWELTYRCTARCAMCSYWKNPTDPRDEMSLPQIQEGIKRVYAYGCRLLNFTGGEPTIRLDLEEIIACASEMGIWTSVVTNGSLLTPERVVRLKEAGLDNLLVSLDSTWPQVHDQQRGVSGLHAQVVECMRWIRSEFLEGHRTGGIMCVISRRNRAHLDEIVDFAHKLGVYVIFQPYHTNKTGNPEHTPEFNEAEARQFLRLKERTRSMLNSRSYLAGIQPFLTQQDRPSCNAGLKYFSIDPFGHLHPCVDMPPVGHILEDDLTALRSEKAQAMVRACRGCWYCFRGEADTSLSLAGCLEKARLGLAVLRRNAAARSHK